MKPNKQIRNQRNFILFSEDIHFIADIDVVQNKKLKGLNEGGYWKICLHHFNYKR